MSAYLEGSHAAQVAVTSQLDRDEHFHHHLALKYVEYVEMGDAIGGHSRVLGHEVRRRALPVTGRKAPAASQKCSARAAKLREMVPRCREREAISRDLKDLIGDNMDVLDKLSGTTLGKLHGWETGGCFEKYGTREVAERILELVTRHERQCSVVRELDMVVDEDWELDFP